MPSDKLMTFFFVCTVNTQFIIKFICHLIPVSKFHRVPSNELSNFLAVQIILKRKISNSTAFKHYLNGGRLTPQG